jgi:hypothetical protein
MKQALLTGRKHHAKDWEIVFGPNIPFREQHQFVRTFRKQGGSREYAEICWSDIGRVYASDARHTPPLEKPVERQEKPAPKPVGEQPPEERVALANHIRERMTRK